MMESIIVAIITGVFAIVAQFIISSRSSSELLLNLEKASEISDQQINAKLEKFQALTNQKIDELSNRVQQHNNIIERTYKLERQVAVHEEKLKNLQDKG